MTIQTWYVRKSTRAKITDWSTAVIGGVAAFDINTVILDPDASPGGTLRTQLWARVGSSVSAGKLAAAQAAQDSGTVPVDPDATEARTLGPGAMDLSGLATVSLSNVDATTGRSALGLGAAATRGVGTSSGTVAAGDDGRFLRAVADYVPGRAYGAGELVVYSGMLYRITTAYTSSGSSLDLSKVAVVNTTVVVPAGTGVSATDVANVQAAHDALPSTGGTIRLQAGTYDLTGGVTFSKQVLLIGHGSGGFTALAPTRIVANSQTATPITVTEHGCSFTDLAIVNTNGTAPTAGAGVLFQAGDAARLTRCKFLGFWNNIEFTQGRYQTITDCLFLDATNYSLFLKNTTAGQGDFGDTSVMGNTFCALTTGRVAQAAVRWESGGGLRFVGNKTNGNYNTLGQSQLVGVHAAVADGVSTSVLVITGNSFEGIQAGGAPVVVTQTGTGTGSFSKIVITGNECLAGAGFRVVGLQTGKLSNIVIANNLLSSNNPGIYLQNCSAITVGRNRHMGMPSGGFAVQVGSAVSDYTVEPQDVDAINAAYLYDDSANANTHSKIGSVGTYAREIPSTTSSSTYTGLFQVQFNAYSSAVIDFTVTGQISGIGSFVYSASRSVTQAAAGTVPTVAVIGTDVSTTNAPTVLVDGTVNQSVSFKVRLPGSGTDLFGQATVRVNGVVSRIWRL